MTQLDVVNVCLVNQSMLYCTVSQLAECRCHQHTCADNVAVLGNLDIVNMYKCSKSKIFFVCLRQIVCLRAIGSKSVTVVECVNPCMPT